MIKKINHTKAIREQLKKEGKSITLDGPDHIAAIDAMNEQLEITTREYFVKDRNSQISASKVTLRNISNTI